MQTFLVSSPQYTAKILDQKRLNKQITESRQILDILNGADYYVNHPAVRMWRGYTEHLKKYTNIMLQYWLYRGGNYKHGEIECLPIGKVPWINDSLVLSSHKMRLLQKDRVFYSQYNWQENDNFDSNLDYYWPVNKNDIDGLKYVEKKVKRNEYRVTHEKRDYILTQLIRKPIKSH